MKNFILLILGTGILFFSSCTGNGHSFDGSGAFEADEIIISSEANGVLKEFRLEEGDSLSAGEYVGYVDSTQLSLRKKQLLAQIQATGSRIPDIGTQTAYYARQIAVYKSRLTTLEREEKRLTNLVAGEAAPQKQLDDIVSQIDEVKKQIDLVQQQQAAQVSVLGTQARGLQNDPLALYAQIEQVEDQLLKCRLVSTGKGTVLVTYVEPNELVSVGKPLYKIADLSTMTLKAYVDGNTLPLIKIGQKVKVRTDDGKGGMKETTGTITWINSKAEFTPKTIQTKDERADLVYAVKVSVVNDGYYKIGMYGEMRIE
ncbi:MAG: HlyD family efflux transporter periplasmic adaptor subunit [Chitinophagaceae bacterium]|nr:HlyD family efflux transporter periplasmic adaptor subunit [Chitinophagaceae bacterium]